MSTISPVERFAEQMRTALGKERIDTINVEVLDEGSIFISLYDREEYRDIVKGVVYNVSGDCYEDQGDGFLVLLNPR